MSADLLRFLYDFIKSAICIRATAWSPLDRIFPMIRQRVCVPGKVISLRVPLSGHESTQDSVVYGTYRISNGAEQAADRVRTETQPCQTQRHIVLLQCRTQSLACIGKTICTVETVYTQRAETAVPDGHMTIADVVVYPDVIGSHRRKHTVYRFHIFPDIPLVIHADSSVALLAVCVHHCPILPCRRVIQILMVMSNGGKNIDTAGKAARFGKYNAFR